MSSFFFRYISLNRGVLASFGTLIMLSQCIEPYSPPSIEQDVSILVIDGFLNSNEGSATVRLSHAQTLSDNEPFEGEKHAIVSIQAGNGTTYSLLEGDSGKYMIAGIPVEPGEKYRLNVHTMDDGEYVSDLMEAINTPAIDSLTWSGDESGVKVLVNTHDASGRSRNYAWEYVETWQYHAVVSSDFILVNQVPVYRTDAERIYNCWRTLSSTKISVATSTRLADDVIHAYPVAFVPRGSNKISIKYSILVKQRVISSAEFDFLEQLKKSTESIGGLFDPQPSQVTGNIHNIKNPTIPVLGYFSIGNVTQERIFIDYLDLPDPLRKISRPAGCEADTVSLGELKNISPYSLIGSGVYSGHVLVGYTTTVPRCADCRTQGGILTKPSFWP